MAVILRVTVDAPDDRLAEYGAGALIRYERAPAIDGVYAELFTQAIEPNVFSYEKADPSGTLSSWYRTRYSDVALTSASTYSDPFAPSEPPAYANLDDFLLGIQATRDTRFLASAERRLVEATEEIDNELEEVGGHSFFRVPRTGTTSIVVNGLGGDLLHVHRGIVELTSVDIRTEWNGSWNALDPAAGWALEGNPGEYDIAAGLPAFHVRIAPVGTYTSWPRIRQAVRLTGVFGWPTVPELARAACVAWARQKVALDPNLAGGEMGPEEFGGPPTSNRKPDVVYRLIKRERERHWCHL